MIYNLASMEFLVKAIRDIRLGLMGRFGMMFRLKSQMILGIVLWGWLLSGRSGYSVEVCPSEWIPQTRIR